MGKQTVFFATPLDIEGLLHETGRVGGIILDQNGITMDSEKVLNKCIACFNGELFGCNLFLTMEGLQISFLPNGTDRRIDPIRSEVIAFNPCTQQPKLLLDTSAVDNYFKKDNFVVIDDIVKYEEMMAALMKKPIYRENPVYVENGFNHARLWFEPTYLSDSNKVMKKCELICSLYSFLQKHINTTCIPAINRFGYIAKDAYRRYLAGEFVPCSGKEQIKFKGGKAAALCVDRRPFPKTE